jgi:hypothetical protein
MRLELYRGTPHEAARSEALKVLERLCHFILALARVHELASGPKKKPRYFAQFLIAKAARRGMYQPHTQVRHTLETKPTPKGDYNAFGGLDDNPEAKRTQIRETVRIPAGGG